MRRVIRSPACTRPARAHRISRRTAAATPAAPALARRRFSAGAPGLRLLPRHEAMNDQDQMALRQLLDRQAILDCLHRYTRGVDRLDRQLLLSAYHADAIDDHGLFV